MKFKQLCEMIMIKVTMMRAKQSYGWIAHADGSVTVKGIVAA
jgi:hypothetical protein